MLARQILDLRQQQKLALTPQLQQSIKLLQLSGAELDQEILQALLDNPMLERVDDPLEYGIKEAEPLSQNEPEVLSVLDFTNLGASSGAEDDLDWLQNMAQSEGLSAYLDRQLAAKQIDQRERALAQLIIAELDDNAYLETSLEELLLYLPDELEVELSELEEALYLVQSLDPAGVGARDLAECLTLQLQRVQAKHVDPILACAYVLIQEHLNSLSSMHKLKHALGTRYGANVLQAAHKRVLALDPKPGRAWTQNTADFITPDVLLREVSGRWQVRLNPWAVPRLRLAQMDEHALLQSPSLQQARQKASGFIRGVSQRFATVLRVANAIVERQQAFFSEGQTAMQPLQLRDIALATELHESTVSRATRLKYMQTPLGMFELKYFFSTAVAGFGAQAPLSALAIRAHIVRLIQSEPAHKPYSDQRLSDMLCRQGIDVARRTVAKYRELEGIESAVQRRMRAHLGHS